MPRGFLVTKVTGLPCINVKNENWTVGRIDYGNRILDGLNSEVVARNAFSFKIYRKVLTVFYVEERMKAFARQGKCSFVASSRGHELTQFPKAPKPCRR